MRFTTYKHTLVTIAHFFSLFALTCHWLQQGQDEQCAPGRMTETASGRRHDGASDHKARPQLVLVLVLLFVPFFILSSLPDDYTLRRRLFLPLPSILLFCVSGWGEGWGTKSGTLSIPKLISSSLFFSPFLLVPLQFRWEAKQTKSVRREGKKKKSSFGGALSPPHYLFCALILLFCSGPEQNICCVDQKKNVPHSSLLLLPRGSFSTSSRSGKKQP